jgi:hypothetical protein
MVCLIQILFNENHIRITFHKYIWVSKSPIINKSFIFLNKKQIPTL